MQEDNILEILKQAILLETRGRAFYRKIAEQAEDRQVKDIFEIMADEEQQHIQTLSEQYKTYRRDKTFGPANYDAGDTGKVASEVLTSAIKKNLSAAGFEAAAISAAIALEERAVELYSRSAETASDPEARAFYEWLTRWEREHLNFLLDIDKALKEKIWFDNSFWPF